MGNGGGFNGELLKGLAGLVPHVMNGSKRVPVTVRVEIEAGPTAETINRAAKALSERTRTRLPNGTYIETLNLAKPGAIEAFLEVCAKAGIDVEAIKDRLRSEAPRGPMIPAEQLIQLSRVMTQVAREKK